MREDIALLEYDSCKDAVIMPGREHVGLRLPETAVFAFVDDTLDRYAAEHKLPVAAEFVSITKKYPVYIAECNRKKICLCQAPCGSAPATQILDWLIGYGVKNIISAGSCGVLADIPENTFLIPERAVRDEGTSFHYLPPGRYIDLNREMVDIIDEYFRSQGIHCERVMTWTTDGFFRETAKKVKERAKEGCAAVDMECSALAACAEFRGVRFGQFFFSADTLYLVDNYDERDWGRKSLLPALLISVDIASKL